MPWKKCAECGVSFHAKTTRAKYCSDRCRVAFNRRTTPIEEATMAGGKASLALGELARNLTPETAQEIRMQLDAIQAQLSDLSIKTDAILAKQKAG